MANSAKRDPNGTWHIQYRYTDWTGKKRKSSKKGLSGFKGSTNFWWRTYGEDSRKNI